MPSAKILRVFDAPELSEAQKRAGQPPSNVEVEQALLGAFLADNAAIYEVSDELAAKHFYEPIHREIFSAIKRQMGAGKSATPPSLARELPEFLAEDFSMAKYLVRLASAAAPRRQVKERAEIVVDLWRRRLLLVIGEQLVTGAYDDEISSEDQVRRAETEIFSLRKEMASPRFEGVAASLTEAIKSASEAYVKESAPIGIGTGFSELDHLIRGLRPGYLYVAHSPSDETSTLATNIAMHVARTWPMGAEDGPNGPMGGRVAYFSHRMAAEQLATRILSESSGIPAALVRLGQIHEDQFSRLVNASNEMARLPLFIDDEWDIDAQELAARCRRQVFERGVDLIVVDGLELLRGLGSADERGMLRPLKRLAGELQAPVLALCETDWFRRNIEIDPASARTADAIMQLALGARDDDSIRRLAHVIVDRNSSGPKGIARVVLNTSGTETGSPAQEPSSSNSFDKNEAFLERAQAHPIVALESSSRISDPKQVAAFLGGPQVLGRVIESYADMARAVADGLPYAAIDALARAGFTSREIEEIVGAPRTLARRKVAGRLSQVESGAAERMARMFSLAERVLGDRVAALNWMRKPMVVRLSGRSPMEFLSSDAGAKVVEEILLQAEFGVTA